MKVENIQKRILVLGAIAFVAVGLLSFTNFGMSTNADGQMLGCPFMGIPTLCQMNHLDHAFALQNMLVAVPFSGIFTLLISILLVLSLVLLAPVFLSIVVNLFEPLLHPPRRTSRLVPRNTLQEAFSNGLLNSRAF